MNAPLTRDQQIELMKASAERHTQRFAAWVANGTVRETLSRPAPGQTKAADYTHQRRRIACG